MSADKCFMQTKFVGAPSNEQNFTGRKWSKVDELNRYILVITDIDEK